MDDFNPHPPHIVDIKENPGVGGSILVEATSPTGTIESATFTGPRAAIRAFAYIEAIEGYERREPREYPKHVRRGGVDHLVLDAQHEKAIGPPTEADKQSDDAQAKALDDVRGQHAAFDEAQARATSGAAMFAPRPVRSAEGESDEAYAARVADWQTQRRTLSDAQTFLSFPQSEPQNTPANAEPWMRPGVEGDQAQSAVKASSPEAARIRDIAARRRAPDIENVSED